MLLLVGDNAFQGVSHLSQERARSRDRRTTTPRYAAEIIVNSVNSGADGFMFSVSETTLLILRQLDEWGRLSQMTLIGIVPYAYDYVSLATQLGLPRAYRMLLVKFLSSFGISILNSGLKGILCSDPVALMEAYLKFELSRVKAHIGKQTGLKALLLHELVTDTALALNLKWLFDRYVKFMKRLGVAPGFETRNFPILAERLEEWGLDSERLVVAAPFNLVGFQMNPSKDTCEKALANVRGLEVIAISILAAGYLRLPDALSYVESLPKLAGVVVGVSNPEQAVESFKALRKRFPHLQEDLG